MTPHLETPPMTFRPRLAPALLLGLAALGGLAHPGLAREARDARAARAAHAAAGPALRPMARPDPFRDLVLTLAAEMPSRPSTGSALGSAAPAALMAGPRPGKTADDRVVPLEITVAQNGAQAGGAACRPAPGPEVPAFEMNGFDTCSPFVIDTGLTDARLLEAHAYWTRADIAVIDYAALQGFHLARDLPSVVLALGPVTETERLAQGLEARIRSELAARHELRYGQPDDLERLFDLADGAALKDWGRAPDRFLAAEVSEAFFQAPAPAPVAPAAPAAPVEDPGLAELRGFLATPEGLAALARLSPQEMAAVLRIAAGTAAPAAEPTQPAAPVAAPRRSGVPSLRFEDDAEVPALSTGGASDGPVLGGSENLLLRGWRVAQDGAGVIMFLDNSPGSTLRVVPGMVLGPLGAVTDVQVGPEGAAVSFESGDVLREDPAAAGPDGVEPL